MSLIRSRRREKEEDAPAGRNMPAYSYHNVRREQDIGLGRNIKEVSTKQIKKARKLWLEKFGLIILAVVVVISLISILYLSSHSTVILENDSSNDPVFSSYKSAVAQSANKLLAGSFLNANKITVNTSKIVDTLESQYPMYSDISLTLPLIDHHPVIYLTPATPSIILSTSAGQYLLTQNGLVMEHSDSSTSFNYLKLPEVGYNSGQSIQIGQQELTTQEVQFIQTIIYELQVKGEKITTLALPQGTSQLNANILGKSYYVKFNLQDNNPKEQAGSLLATQHYLQTQNVNPAQYIDVRTEGRVYYQ